MLGWSQAMRVLCAIVGGGEDKKQRRERKKRSTERCTAKRNDDRCQCVGQCQMLSREANGGWRHCLRIRANCPAVKKKKKTEEQW